MAEQTPVGPRIAILGGTGRMGVPLAANWAHAGYEVMITSRNVQKAQKIVYQLLTGRGLRMAAPAGGGIEVPPLRDQAAAKRWRLTAGSVRDAVTADVIVLGVIFDQQWAQLAEIKDELMGQGKVFIDMTNPYIPRPEMTTGIPKGEMPPGGPAAVLYHQAKLGDPTARWCGAFKHVLWMNIQPDGSAKRAEGVDGVEVFGDAEAVEITTQIIRRSGWRPVVRGDLSVAPQYEIKGPKAKGTWYGFFGSPDWTARFIGDKLTIW